ncbi:hypothetical protein VCR12J2_640326 [Vibrio coralliirubri]|nr:hypothetical protein VCR12J2_640326 [Vibrio coralliirubri]
MFIHYSSPERTQTRKTNKHSKVANRNCILQLDIAKTQIDRSNTHQIAIKLPFYVVLKVGTLTAMCILTLLKPRVT